MLQLDLRAVAQGPIAVAVTLPLDDPLVAEFGHEVRDPVRLTGRVMETGPGEYFWNGHILTVVHCECRRCLAGTDVKVDAPVSVLFTEEEDPDDPAAYSIPRNATHLDLSGAVREELILAVPEYPLCREDCRGICAQCGKDLNLGSCLCRPETDPRWEVLEALRKPKPDHARE